MSDATLPLPVYITGGTPTTFNDSTFSIFDNIDTTKFYKIQCQYISTGSTSTAYVPDSDIIFPAQYPKALAGGSNTNVLTGNVGYAINYLGGALRNTAYGRDAGLHVTTSTDNSLFGCQAGTAITTGANNSLFGSQTGSVITIGNNNVLLGSGANTDVNNRNNCIAIGHGTTTAAFDNSIRIGFGTAASTRCFVDGVTGTTTAGAAVAVLVDGSGQLGTISSSLRYKQNVQDMSVSGISDKLMQLRPVTFNWKPSHSPNLETQYGLIAEEVDQVMPEIVVYKNYDVDGETKLLPETVAYHLLVPLMLNE